MRFLLLSAVITMSASTFAATQKNYCGTSEIKESNCKNIPGNRRDELGSKVSGGNPVAISLDKGNLYMYYTTGKGLRKCQVTGGVEQFKLSSNPGDVAAAYYIRNGGDLFDLRVAGDVTSSCPKASKVNMIEHAGSNNVINGKKVNQAKGEYRFRIVSNSNSEIVGIALLDNGDVFYWTDKEYGKSDSKGNKGYEALWKQSQ